MPAQLEADLVIIGAGSAGCVLAHRLSEESNLQVLVLEAGERDSSFLTDVPGLTMRLMGNPQTDWCHLAEPDPTLNGRALIWHAGKMLGGGSGINGLVYIRGLRRDYDDWAAAGCSGLVLGRCGSLLSTSRAFRRRRACIVGNERSALGCPGFAHCTI